MKLSITVSGRSPEEMMVKYEEAENKFDFLKHLNIKIDEIRKSN